MSQCRLALNEGLAVCLWEGGGGMSKTDAMPYIVGFVAGLIVTGLVLSNLDAELVGRLQRRMSDDMVRIGGGSFVMGCDPKSGWNCVAEEEPAQLVKVEAFGVDRFEVTADEYQACVDAGVCFYRGSISDQRRTFKNSRGNHPINLQVGSRLILFVYGVASAYRPMRSGRRRARGPDGLRFPWGNESMPSCDIAIVDQDDEPDNGTERAAGTGFSWPVGSRPQGASSKWVIQDMIGNVWEHRSLETKLAGSFLVTAGDTIGFVSRFEGNRLSAWERCIYVRVTATDPEVASTVVRVERLHLP